MHAPAIAIILALPLRFTLGRLAPHASASNASSNACLRLAYVRTGLCWGSNQVCERTVPQRSTCLRKIAHPQASEQRSHASTISTPANRGQCAAS